MPDTGAPWNIPYVAGTDLVADWPTDSQTLATAIANGLDQASNIAQVKYAVQTTNFTTTSTSLTDLTGASISITPTSTNNNILMIWTGNVGVNEADQYCDFRFRRDTTDLFESIRVTTHGTASQTTTPTMAFVEQAQSTSATNYLIRCSVGNNTLTVTSSTLIVIEYVP